MKVFILSFITVAILTMAFQTDEILTASVYQGNVIDQLDPSWPKLA